MLDSLRAGRSVLDQVPSKLSCVSLSLLFDTVFLSLFIPLILLVVFKSFDAFPMLCKPRDRWRTPCAIWDVQPCVFQAWQAVFLKNVGEVFGDDPRLTRLEQLASTSLLSEDDSGGTYPYFLTIKLVRC